MWGMKLISDLINHKWTDWLTPLGLHTQRPSTLMAAAIVRSQRIKAGVEEVDQQCHLVVIENMDGATVRDKGSSSGFGPGPWGRCFQAASGRTPPCPPTCRLRSAPGRWHTGCPSTPWPARENNHTHMHTHPPLNYSSEICRDFKPFGLMRLWETHARMWPSLSECHLVTESSHSSHAILLDFHKGYISFFLKWMLILI